jgi:3-hydroxyisobutyrate dehydrogenase-like beta-hydroxyacid dehydrogenase
VVRNVRRFISGEHAPVNFTPELRLKDIDYALRLARQLGVRHELGAAAEALYRRLIDLGFGHENESRIIDAVRS